MHLSLISIGAPLSLAVNRILCSLRLIFQNTLTVGARHTLMHRCAPNSIMRGAQTAPCQSAAQGNARAFLILNTLSARNQSDFDKIIQTKRAEACIAEDQGALRERQWMESAQAVYPNPQACASIDCDCSGKRRARPGSPERAPLANRQDGE